MFTDRFGGPRSLLAATPDPLYQKTRQEQDKSGRSQQTDSQQPRVRCYPAAVRHRKRQRRQSSHPHQEKPPDADAFEYLGQNGPHHNAMENGTPTTFAVVVIE
jgi:hypothetical protein